WRKEGVAGSAVALLLAEICLVGFLLDVPKPWLTGLPEAAPDNWHRGVSAFIDGALRLLVPQPQGELQEVRQWRQLRWYLSVTWLPLLLGLACLTLQDLDERWGFLPGLAAAVLVVGAFVWLFQQLNAAHINDRLLSFASRLPPPLIIVSMLGTVFVGLLLLAGFVPHMRLPVLVLLGVWTAVTRSEEHTSELQSPDHLVCRLLLETTKITHTLDHI